MEKVSEALARHHYLADEGITTAVFPAFELRRSLLLDGEVGAGKTEVSKGLSRWTGGELLRLQCYQGVDAARAAYEWDCSRQLLHLRAVEASHAQVSEDDLHSERFLVRRPLRGTPGPRTDCAAPSATRAMCPPYSRCGRCSLPPWQTRHAGGRVSTAVYAADPDRYVAAHTAEQP